MHLPMVRSHPACGCSPEVSISSLPTLGIDTRFKRPLKASVRSNVVLAKFVHSSLPVLAHSSLHSLSPSPGYTFSSCLRLPLTQPSGQRISQPLLCLQELPRRNYDASVANHNDSPQSVLYKLTVVAFLASSVLLTPAAEALGSYSNSEDAAGSLANYYITKEDLQSSNKFSSRVSEAVDLLEKGQLAQARGDFLAALDCFTEVTAKAGDLALAEYARVGHALTMYEVGDRGQAIIEMEDVSISLKGYPEIHAALAAALYADKHAPLPAERQFTIATLLDPRYTDLTWVQKAKHWPPSLLNSLERFISLR